MRMVHKEINLNSQNMSTKENAIDNFKRNKRKVEQNTFGPYCLMNHSEVLGFDASNIVLSRPRRPIIFAIISARTESACLHTSSASSIIISAPASKHLSDLLINKSTSSTSSAETKTKFKFKISLILMLHLYFHVKSKHNSHMKQPSVLIQYNYMFNDLRDSLWLLTCVYIWVPSYDLEESVHHKIWAYFLNDKAINLQP